MNDASHEVVVIGGGPAGLMAAIALAGAGVETALVAGAPATTDHRTTALLAGSVDALDTVGVWDRCRNDAAPLRVMRIIDDTKRLLRAPEVRFEACEIGLEAFGQNIENRRLLAALEAQAHELPALTMIAGHAVALAFGDDRASVSLVDGSQKTARLVVGADGRRSLCRAAAGITTSLHNYPQVALTFNLNHSRPHLDISTEFHTEAGPFTLVPLPGHRSSLVFVAKPDELSRLSALSDQDMAAEIEHRSHSILGKIALEPGRGQFPLVAETARSIAGHRLVLVGEAAHVLPPIGAQGLNLGMRDAATIAELAAAAHRQGADVGSNDVTTQYEHKRRADVTSRALAIDVLNRSLLSDFLPIQGLRGLGFFLMQQIGPLRRAAMREGVTPAASQPRLMRGEVL